MRILVETDYASLSERAAQLVSAKIMAQTDPLVVLPTGATPLGLFDRLLERSQAGEIDLKRARFLTLDEYAGISMEDERSLGSWLWRALLGPAAVPVERFSRFDPTTDEHVECERRDAEVRKNGGIDLLVLGLGLNGHLGFNEPGSPSTADPAWSS